MASLLHNTLEGSCGILKQKLQYYVNQQTKYAARLLHRSTDLDDEEELMNETITINNMTVKLIHLIAYNDYEVFVCNGYVQT